MLIDRCIRDVEVCTLSTYRSTVHFEQHKIEDVAERQVKLWSAITAIRRDFPSVGARGQFSCFESARPLFVTISPLTRIRRSINLCNRRVQLIDDQVHEIGSSHPRDIENITDCVDWVRTQRCSLRTEVRWINEMVIS